LLPARLLTSGANRQYQEQKDQGQRDLGAQRRPTAACSGRERRPSIAVRIRRRASFVVASTTRLLSPTPFGAPFSAPFSVFHLPVTPPQHLS
jgi:hypothetical protein